MQNVVQAGHFALYVVYVMHIIQTLISVTITSGARRQVLQHRLQESMEHPCCGGTC